MTSHFSRLPPPSPPTFVFPSLVFSHYIHTLYRQRLSETETTALNSANCNVPLQRNRATNNGPLAHRQRRLNHSQWHTTTTTPSTLTPPRTQTTRRPYSPPSSRPSTWDRAPPPAQPRAPMEASSSKCPPSRPPHRNKTNRSRPRNSKRRRTRRLRPPSRHPRRTRGPFIWIFPGGRSLRPMRRMGGTADTRRTRAQADSMNSLQRTTGTRKHCRKKTMRTSTMSRLASPTRHARQRQRRPVPTQETRATLPIRRR